MRKLILLVLGLALGVSIVQANAACPTGSTNCDYSIGVFYFPGWKSNQKGAPSNEPWTPIKPYNDRIPALGWYAEDGAGVMDQQLRWMRDSGIDFVVFDSYWGREGVPYLETGIRAYLKSPLKSEVKFSVLWANHSKIPENPDQFYGMVRYWINNYFNRPEYVRIDGMPAVWIFSQEQLQKNAEGFGMSAAALLQEAQSIAHSSGLKGIYFIAGTWANSTVAKTPAAQSGYSAVSAYNWHGMGTRRYPDGHTVSHSYAELDVGYQDHWAWLIKYAAVPLIMPMTSGWDKRPWGGSKDPLHDQSLSTPVEFSRHLSAARAMMDQYPDQTKRMGVICCWNEFGEGSFIEPTKLNGTAYLDQVKSVFGR